MASLDTNVLVRYLVADDRKQFQSPKAFIESATRENPLVTPLAAWLEMEWVRRSLYALDKNTILTVFNRLLGSIEIEFQEESSIEVALSLYTDHNTDFADCLHIASAFSHDRLPLMTFDRKASRVTGAHLL